MIGEDISHFITVLWLALIGRMMLRSAFFAAWHGWFGFVVALVYLLAQSELLATAISCFPEVPAAGLLGSLLWLFPVALAGQPLQVLGDPELLHRYSYMPDIGKALVILGAAEQALGQVWRVPSAMTVTTRQFLHMVEEVIEKPVRVQTAPKLLLQLFVLFNRDLREVLELIYQFEEPFMLDGRKFTQGFGNHVTPLPVALQVRPVPIAPATCLAVRGAG